MFDIDKWEEIFHTISKNKLRTFLTAFSVSWGIFMLILLLGFGTGFHNGVKWQFRDDAMNSIRIYPGQTSIPYAGIQPGKRIQFTNQDFEIIKRQVQGVEHITARNYLSGEFTVRYGSKYASFSVRACHPAHLHLEKTKVIRGRFLNDLDITNRRKVTAIGTEVVETLFGNEDPIGKWIDVNGIKYRVVGIYEDDGNENELRYIYIPISTSQMAYGGGNRINGIMFTVGDASVKEALAMEEEVRSILTERHHFSPEDERAVRIWNNREFFQKFQDLFAGIKLFLWVVGFGTIIAGIVGVSNIMLIVVKERTREIGLRKALGATPASIIGLFIQESVLITVVAGYLGLCLGIGLIEFINWAIVEFNIEAEFFRNPEIDIITATAATVMLVIAGVTAGIFPARKASKISPIEALRDE